MDIKNKDIYCELKNGEAKEMLKSFLNDHLREARSRLVMFEEVPLADVALAMAWSRVVLEIPAEKEMTTSAITVPPEVWRFFWPGRVGLVKLVRLVRVSVVRVVKVVNVTLVTVGISVVVAVVIAPATVVVVVAAVVFVAGVVVVAVVAGTVDSSNVKLFTKQPE
jgi:hypothetical protein